MIEKCFLHQWNFRHPSGFIVCDACNKIHSEPAQRIKKMNHKNLKNFCSEMITYWGSVCNEYEEKDPFSQWAIGEAEGSLIAYSRMMEEILKSESKLRIKGKQKCTTKKNIKNSPSNG